VRLCEEGCRALWWACLSVCLSVCLHISETTWPNLTKYLRILPVAMVQSSSDGVTIRYALPVWCMTSSIHIMSKMACHVHSRMHACMHAHTHTHTHTSVLWPSGLWLWLPGWADTRTNLDFTEARDREWQRHQLGHSQICTSPQTNRLTMPAPHRLVFLQAGYHSSCHPTNCIRALKARSCALISR